MIHHPSLIKAPKALRIEDLGSLFAVMLQARAAEAQALGGRFVFAAGDIVWAIDFSEGWVRHGKPKGWAPEVTFKTSREGIHAVMLGHVGIAELPRRGLAIIEGDAQRCTELLTILRPGGGIVRRDVPTD